jgi:hypothetical protein
VVPGEDGTAGGAGRGADHPLAGTSSWCGIARPLHAAPGAHEALPHAWLVALAGVVSVLFGIAMFAWPLVGLLTLVYLVGIYAIVYGVIAKAVADGPLLVTNCGRRTAICLGGGLRYSRGKLP